jgi:hypothetical protein
VSNRAKRQKGGRPFFEALEDQVLYSADALGGLDALAFRDRDDSIIQASLLPVNRQDDDASAQQTQSAENHEYTRAYELVFVDTNTSNYQQLVDDLLLDRTDERRFDVFILNNEYDGIEQISDVLSGYDSLDAVHIISHGFDSTINIGATDLDADALHANSAAIAVWGDAFDGIGDFLIYGCDLAATSDGQNLVDSLARITGTDVAVSVDLAGAALLGGDWGLEYRQGDIESAVAHTTSIENAVLVTTADVVLIDMQLDDASTLIDSTTAGSVIFAYDGTQESASSVLHRVANWAASSHNEIHSLSILSHGADGAFELGNQWITTATLADFADDWAAVSQYFSQGADIYILGCDVGADGSGQALIDQLSVLTKADVFASDDVTGVGGDWILELASNGLSAEEAASFKQIFDINQLQTAKVSLAWYNASWGYRQSVTVSETMRAFGALATVGTSDRPTVAT